MIWPSSVRSRPVQVVARGIDVDHDRIARTEEGLEHGRSRVGHGVDGVARREVGPDGVDHGVAEVAPGVAPVGGRRRLAGGRVAVAQPRRRLRRHGEVAAAADVGHRRSLPGTVRPAVAVVGVDRRLDLLLWAGADPRQDLTVALEDHLEAGDRAAPVRVRRAERLAQRVAALRVLRVVRDGRGHGPVQRVVFDVRRDERMSEVPRGLEAADGDVVVGGVQEVRRGVVVLEEELAGRHDPGLVGDGPDVRPVHEDRVLPHGGPAVHRDPAPGVGRKVGLEGRRAHRVSHVGAVADGVVEDRQVGIVEQQPDVTEDEELVPVEVGVAEGELHGVVPREVEEDLAGDGEGALVRAGVPGDLERVRSGVAIGGVERDRRAVVGEGPPRGVVVLETVAPELQGGGGGAGHQSQEREAYDAPGRMVSDGSGVHGAFPLEAGIRAGTPPLGRQVRRMGRLSPLVGFGGRMSRGNGGGGFSPGWSPDRRAGRATPPTAPCSSALPS